MDFLHFLPVKCEKFGIEPSVDASTLAQTQGINILGETILDLDKEARFDVITILDVIEHVEQPTQLMRSLSERLNPNGSLIVLTGANDSIWFRLLAPRYWYCSISEHLVFVSKKWSIQFAAKHDLHLVRYDLIICDPKPTTVKILGIARALVHGFIVPLLIKIPKFAKMIGLGRFLLWKNAPMTMCGKDHVIAIFQKRQA